MSSSSIPRPVVLVVDDEPLLRMDAAMALEALGCCAIVAGEAETALAEVERHPGISVLFTDINMPGRDGLELARIIHGRRPDMRLVITSGRERPTVGEMPAHSCFVPKPYESRLIAALIVGMAGGRSGAPQ